MQGALTVEIDARGLKCPLPVLKAEKKLAELPPGAMLVVLADDPVARIDIPLFCQKSGFSCDIERQDAFIRFRIVKG